MPVRSAGGGSTLLDILNPFWIGTDATLGPVVAGLPIRRARARPGYSRGRRRRVKDVDGRIKSGHDEVEVMAVLDQKPTF